MIRRWGFTLTELDEMIPFEREIYVAQVIQELERRSKQVASD